MGSTRCHPWGRLQRAPHVSGCPPPVGRPADSLACPNTTTQKSGQPATPPSPTASGPSAVGSVGGTVAKPRKVGLPSREGKVRREGGRSRERKKTNSYGQAGAQACGPGPRLTLPAPPILPAQHCPTCAGQSGHTRCQGWGWELRAAVAPPPRGGSPASSRPAGPVAHGGSRGAGGLLTVGNIPGGRGVGPPCSPGPGRAVVLHGSPHWQPQRQHPGTRRPPRGGGASVLGGSNAALV